MRTSNGSLPSVSAHTLPSPTDTDERSRSHVGMSIGIVACTSPVAASTRVISGSPQVPIHSEPSPAPMPAHTRPGSAVVPTGSPVTPSSCTSPASVAIHAEPPATCAQVGVPSTATGTAPAAAMSVGAARLAGPLVGGTDTMNAAASAAIPNPWTLKSTSPRSSQCPGALTLRGRRAANESTRCQTRVPCQQSSSSTPIPTTR